MLIRIRTDNFVNASPALTGRAEATIRDSVERFADRLTRVEAFLKDENATKGGERDKTCTLEARLAGLDPIATTHSAPTLDLAIEGAAEKLARAMERAVARAEKPAAGVRSATGSTDAPDAPGSVE